MDNKEQYNELIALYNLDENKVADLLGSATFNFAKTMPKNPHFYTMKFTWKDKNLFKAVVSYIREKGVKEKFFNVEYTYLYVNGHKYWTMGAPLKETILINKAKA